jgi:membrane-associated phospholipid phosphatase
LSVSEPDLDVSTANRKPWRPTWWREIAYVAAFYAIYTVVRNLHGSVLSVSAAEKNAATLVDIERWFRMFNEQQIQEWFLPHEWFIKFLNVYYGTAHFIVTIGVLLWLFHVQKERYRQWRNVIFGTTAFALLGYMLIPMAPPRLLPDSYGFVDTLQTVGGLWDFDSGAVAKASNQYAAMPSLHVGWSVWCAAAIMPILRHGWSRVLIAIYPALTITTIVVTGNHYWGDVFGGLVVFALGYLAALQYEKYANRLQRPLPEDDAEFSVGGHHLATSDDALPASHR